MPQGPYSKEKSRRQPDYPLVNKVAYVGEDVLAQFHSQKPRTNGGAQAPFKTLEDGSRQIRLLPK